MTQPKFNIGEEVVLQSDTYPELNGECTVLSVSDKVHFGYWCHGSWKNSSPCHSYTTSIKSPYDGWWAEIALKKKPKPSKDSFSQMMDKLKLGVPV
jgi:hypothetical protein